MGFFEDTVFSIPTPTTFVTVDWLEGVALSLGSQALAGDTQAPTDLALTSPSVSWAQLSAQVVPLGTWSRLLNSPTVGSGLMEWPSWRLEV